MNPLKAVNRRHVWLALLPLIALVLFLVVDPAIEGGWTAYSPVVFEAPGRGSTFEVPITSLAELLLPELIVATIAILAIVFLPRPPAQALSLGVTFWFVSGHVSLLPSQQMELEPWIYLVVSLAWVLVMWLSERGQDRSETT